jgi:hypothetical protein
MNMQRKGRTLLDETLCGEDFHLLQNDLVVSFDILLIPVDLSNDYLKKEWTNTEVNHRQDLGNNIIAPH